MCIRDRSGVDNDHIIEIALDGIENEELRDPKKCYQHIKDAMKDDQKYCLLYTSICSCLLHSLGRANSNDLPSWASAFFSIFNTSFHNPVSYTHLGDTYIKTVYGMGYQWTGGEKK